MRSRTLPNAALALAVAALVMAIMIQAPVGAQSAPRATLYVVPGGIPASVTTAAALLRHARSHRARTIAESTDAPLEERRWRGSVVMSFTRGIGVRNLTLLTYDVTDGARELTGSSVDIFVRNVTDTSLVTDFNLPRPRFRPNHEVEFVVTMMREPVGSVRVRLTGELPRGNGALDFTQAEPDPTVRHR